MGSAAVCEAPLTRSASACEDRRITRSKRALRQALIALLEERGFDSITVNDLCDRADLNRGTFYNHFRDKENLLAVLEDEVMADIAALQERMQRISLADMLAYRVAGTPLPLLVDLFDYLREQSDFLHAVLGPGGDARFAPRLREAVCENLVQTSCTKNTARILRRSSTTMLPSMHRLIWASSRVGSSVEPLNHPKTWRALPCDFSSSTQANPSNCNGR